MKNILVITGILPVTTIERKKKENDILLETEQQLRAFGKEVKFTYVFNLPRTTRFLGLFKKRWKEYNAIQNAKFFFLREHKIYVIGIIRLPKIASFRNIFFDVSYWLNKKHIAEIIKISKPDIIHAQDADSSAYLARIISGEYNIPYVITVRNIHKVKDKLVQRNLNAASKLIAVSPTQLKDASGLTNKNIELVPHGIDAKFFVKAKRKFHKGQLKFVVVARLLDWKYIDRVINALSNVNNDYIFDIYGDGPEFDRLQEIIKTKSMESKVFLKGRVSNERLPEILLNYDMFLMPSYPETLGRVYFEAMACGLPVLATKNTGIDGIITQGVEGFLVQPIQDSINEYILKISKNPEMLSKMGEAAYQTAKKYSWEIISQKYYEIYHSI
jgi:glycosyltransferase involved in cell wall biosynthesis